MATKDKKGHFETIVLCKQSGASHLNSPGFGCGKERLNAEVISSKDIKIKTKTIL
jgi:hypothetical protein